MLKKEMLDTLNSQMNNEFHASYAYLAMASYFEFKGLNGFAKWFQAQAEEERTHAFKFYRYINEQGEQAILKSIAEPKNTWESPLAVFQNALKHEEGVTSSINEMTDLAITLKDHATQIFLQWFVSEQVEEESNFNAIIQKLKFIGDHPQAILFMDRELGQRSAH